MRHVICHQGVWLAAAGRRDFNCFCKVSGAAGLGSAGESPSDWVRLYVLESAQARINANLSCVVALSRNE